MTSCTRATGVASLQYRRSAPNSSARRWLENRNQSSRGGQREGAECLSVTGDNAGVDAVSAEGLIKTTLWEHPNGAQPIVSTVARFADLSPKEQDQWRGLLQREMDGW